MWAWIAVCIYAWGQNIECTLLRSGCRNKWINRQKLLLSLAPHATPKGNCISSWNEPCAIRHLLELIWEKPWHSQVRHDPSSISWAYPKNLHRRHPSQMPEPPHLGPFEEKLYSTLCLKRWHVPTHQWAHHTQEAPVGDGCMSGSSQGQRLCWGWLLKLYFL